MDHTETSKPKVVVVGAGFGGLWAVKTLSRAPVDIVLIDRQNYHLFQPLLYQVATAELSPAEIAEPIRSIVGTYRNVTVMLGRVTGVDTKVQHVLTEAGHDVPYDYLILATGARHAYFGHDDWEKFAPGLKLIEDATEIRRRILLAFEHAENETDAAERRRLMNIVVVGGGPTGVEMAGAIAELVRFALAKDFRNIDPRTARIILVEAGPRLLSALPPDLSEEAKHRLEKLGVEVRLNAAVTDVNAEFVEVGNTRIDTRTGIQASPAGEWLGAKCDRAGRIIVDSDLSVPDHPEIFAIGDTAAAFDKAGRPLPGVAPVAKQQGVYIAELIRQRVRGRTSVKPFRYRDYGNFATIGRKAAVIDFGWIHMRGLIAWILWSFAHIYFLIGFRNRVIVAVQWLWAYFTFQRGARLIVGRRE
jgi:NADH:ubiquinone reductase (H+-translocating)